MLHRIFGLTLDSDTALSGVPVATADPVGAAGRWRISLPGDVPAPSGTPHYQTPAGVLDEPATVWRPHAASRILSFPDGADFLVDAAEHRIRGAWRAPLTVDDMLVYLVGPALATAVRLTGRSVLHASAVEVDGTALVVAGASGAGKSTLTAALSDAGFAVITEDVAALDDDPRLLTCGGTRVKLWDESVVALRGTAAALPLLAPHNPTWPKRYLDVSGRRPSREVLPIGSIFAVSRDAAAPAVRVEELSPVDRVLSLVGNAYGAGLLDPEGRATELERFTQLARAVPVRALVMPEDLNQVADAVKALVAAHRAARRAAPGGVAARGER